MVPHDELRMFIALSRKSLLNDLYISPEAWADIRAWGVDELDSKTVEAILDNVENPR